MITLFLNWFEIENQQKSIEANTQINNNKLEMKHANVAIDNEIA